MMDDTPPTNQSAPARPQCDVTEAAVNAGAQRDRNTGADAESASSADAASAHTTGNPNRVALLTGDRICIHCSYNLIGQPIMREPHYNLLIVRCPECGNVASTQEYPVLGKWAGRIGTIFAGLWMILIVVLIGLTSLMIFGLAMGTTELALEGYRDVLYDKHVQWQAASPGRAAGMTSFETWYTAQDKAQLLADAGGIFRTLNHELLLPLLAMVLLVPVVGAMWSVIFIARGAGGLTLLAIILCAIAMAFASISIIDASNSAPIWAHRAAWQQLGVYLLPAFVLCALPCLLFGMIIGRPVARWLVKVMLPPRLWNRMAWLWTTRGLDPPRPQV